MIEVYCQSQRGTCACVDRRVDATAELHSGKWEINEGFHAHGFDDVRRGVEGLETGAGVELRVCDMLISSVTFAVTRYIRRRCR